MIQVEPVENPFSLQDCIQLLIGRVGFRFGEIRICSSSGPEFITGSGIVSKASIDIVAIEMGFREELDATPELQSSTGSPEGSRPWNIRRQNVEAVGAVKEFRLAESAVSAGTNFQVLV